jgi:hypothetical protein
MVDGSWEGLESMQVVKGPITPSLSAKKTEERSTEALLPATALAPMPSFSKTP